MGQTHSIGGMHHGMQHDHQQANARIYAIDIATSAAKEGIVGAGSGAALGGLLCGSTVLGGVAVPGCALTGGLGGAAAGILSGMIAGANGSACQNSSLNLPSPEPPMASCGGQSTVPPPMPSGLGNCPQHGVQHSCPSNPTPSRGRAIAAPPRASCGGNGSCASSCGCK